jgi:hypothetical protein
VGARGTEEAAAAAPPRIESAPSPGADDSVSLVTGGWLASVLAAPAVAGALAELRARGISAQWVYR